MIFHKPLPSIIRQGILNIDVIERTSHLSSDFDGWVPIVTEEIVSTDIIKWFDDRDMRLKPYHGLFLFRPFGANPVHLDNGGQSVAFNFTMSGGGVTRWVDIEADSYQQQWSAGDFTNPTPDVKFKNIKKITERYRWTGTDHVLRIDSPHQGIAGPKGWHLLTLRIIENLPFDEVIKRF